MTRTMSRSSVESIVCQGIRKVSTQSQFMSNQTINSSTTSSNSSISSGQTHEKMIKQSRRLVRSVADLFVSSSGT
jgi:hypothetical protein